jgi:ribosomal protein S18 acetylase RimI-like enzyme
MGTCRTVSCVARYEVVVLATQDDVYRIIRDFDGEFVPALSSRIRDLASYARKLHDSAFVFAARLAASGEVVGFIAFYANRSDTAYTSLIGVRAKYRRSGIGQRLMEQSYAIALSAGMRRMRLEVVDANREARAFYEKNGFTAVGSAGEGTIHLERSL